MEDRTAQAAISDHELFREAFKACPLGIALETLDGQPLFVSPSLCTMLGFSEEEMRKKHCVDFSPPEDAERDWALFQQLRAGSIDHYHLEKRYFRRDGSLVWGSLSVSLLSSCTSLVVAIVEDITDKKTTEATLLEVNRTLRAQTALLQSREELLKTFVKNAPAGVAMLDCDMRYLQAAAGAWITQSTVRKYSDARIMTFFLMSPSTGKQYIAALLKEKRSERTKTAGIVKAAPCGFAGRFVLGRRPTGL